MKTPIVYMILLSSLILTASLAAQNSNMGSHSVNVSIPEVGILNVVGSEDLIISLADCIDRLEPGEHIVNNICVEHNSCDVWLNYTSIKGSGPNAMKAITIEMIGDLPQGVQLLATVDQPTGNGKGAIGNSIATNGIPVTQTPQNIIENIGTGWTGVGEGNGVFVSYGLNISPEIQATEDLVELDIVYTMKNI